MQLRTFRTHEKTVTRHGGSTRIGLYYWQDRQGHDRDYRTTGTAWRKVHQGGVSMHRIVIAVTAVIVVLTMSTAAQGGTRTNVRTERAYIQVAGLG